MKDDWRTTRCSNCMGHMLVAAWVGDYEIADCGECAGGVVWLRPSGHAFAYPGGPARGMYGKEAYEKAEPYVLPPIEDEESVAESAG